MEFPCWRYWADGSQAMVESPAQWAALPPGHRANPGMFLPPDHPAHVPPQDDGPVAYATPPAIESPPAVAVTDGFTASEQDAFDQPVLPVPLPRRKRGRPRKDEVRA